MMLEKLLGSKLRAKLLGWLFTHTDERFYVRQLESLIGEDATNLSRELARLASLGILTMQVEGRQKYFQANHQCPIFTELAGLAVKTTGLANVLAGQLETIEDKITVSFVYGSQAGGQASALSDVDVMIVGEVTFGEIVSLMSPLQDRLGREINPTVYPVAEFRRKHSQKNHFLQTVLKSPKIFLIGDENELKRLASKRLAGRPRHKQTGNRRPAQRSQRRRSPGI
jgi:predicted nucleotidyltransferase